jgi:predicted transcriptional regulator
MWIWRGRMKSRWSDLGFDADVFGLFVKMKGGKTRIKLLDALSLPKDRLQLAQELGMDWKGVDRHLELLKKYGFVQDKVAYGKVRMYELTPVGASLLKLFQELSREEQREAPSAPLSPRLGETAADLVS